MQIAFHFRRRRRAYWSPGLASIVLLAGSLPGTLVANGAPVAERAERVRTFIESAWPADGPGAAVVVARDGRTLVREARGMANLATSEPLGIDSVFALGSSTKQFTAAVILQLVEGGKLSLDDRLSERLPDYGGPGREATIRQILKHSAGIPDIAETPAWREPQNLVREHSFADLVAYFEDREPSFEPGTDWDYSNSGYMLLGAVIEHITGQPWHAAIRKRIAQPLDLESLWYGEAPGAPTGAMAHGYSGAGAGAEPAVDVHLSAAHAAGGLVASAGDMAAWMHALHGGKVIGRSQYKAMTTPTEPNDPETPYGFGLRVDTVRGRDTISHGGWIWGYTNQTVFVPQEDLFIAVLSNSHAPKTSADIAARRIAGFMLGDPYPEFQAVEPDLERLESVFGVYEIKGGGTRQFFSRDGKLYTLRSGSSESRVHSAGENRFFYGPERLTWFEIVRGDNDILRMKMHHQGHREAEIAERTGPVPERAEIIELPESVLKAYVGRYRLNADVVANVELDDGGLAIRLTGQSRLRLQPTSETRFRVEGVDASVEFRHDGEKATGLVINQGGNTMPPAERMD